MPELRQKYSLKMAISPQNSMEGVTFMDLKAIQDEIKRAQGDYEFAIFDCVNEDDSIVKVLVKAADIQMIMHTPFRRTLGEVAPARRLVQ